MDTPAFEKAEIPSSRHNPVSTMAGCSREKTLWTGRNVSKPGKQKNRVVHKIILSYVFFRIRVWMNSVMPSPRIMYIPVSGPKNSSAMK